MKHARSILLAGVLARLAGLASAPLNSDAEPDRMDRSDFEATSLASSRSPRT